jgi:hypothetical protein
MEYKATEKSDFLHDLCGQVLRIIFNKTGRLKWDWQKLTRS